MDMADDVLDYIATNVKKNIRELEGALNKILVYSKINKELNIDTVKKLLKGFVFSPFDVANYKKIIETVARFYNLRGKKPIWSHKKKGNSKAEASCNVFIKERIKIFFPSYC